MSMKRTRTRSYSPSRRDEGPVTFSKQSQESEKSWDELIAGHPDEAFAPYSMKSKYERGGLISHPKFGKGIVTGVEDQRIEVLFAEGKKKLGHGLS